MALLDTSNAVVWDAALRNPNAFVLMGTSRTAAYPYDFPGNLRTNGGHWFAQANARMGRRMRVRAVFGAPGQRSDQFLAQANIDAAIATDAKYVVIDSIVNDVGADTAPDYWNIRYKLACEQFIVSGMTPILLTEPGQTALAGNASARSAWQRFNSHVYDYRGRSYGSVLVFDIAGMLLDLTSTTMAFKSGYSTDGTHFARAAPAIVLGRAFAAMMSPLVPAVPARRVMAGETSAIGWQGFPNPGFLSLVGGAGTAPVNTRVDVGTGAAGTVAISSAANADGSNDLIMTINGTQAGEVGAVFDIPAGFDNAGDRIDVFAQVEIVGGANNLAGPYLRVEDRRNNNSTNYADLNVDGAMGAMPANAAAEVLDLWCPVTVAAGTRNWFTVVLHAYMAAAGTATLKWRHVAADKRPL